MGGGGSRSEDTLKEIAGHVTQNKIMWNFVIQSARALAQLKAHGTYMEPGSKIPTLVDMRERENLTKQFEQNLHRAVEQAYADDARLGAAIAAQMNKDK